MIDVVFSLDSIITAIGMASELAIMIAAVVIACIVMYASSGPVSRFVAEHPTTKMLALAFLVLIGVALVADGFEFHIPRGYIYFAIDHNAQVINLSLSGPPDPLLGRLIDVALSRGMVVVGASDPHMPDGGFPASHPGVVAVSDDPSTTVPGVFIAPGRDTPTTQPGGRFAFSVESVGRPVATWEYELVPSPDGCLVIERTTDQRPMLYKLCSFITLGLGRRSSRNRWTMRQTLNALARAAEC